MKPSGKFNKVTYGEPKGLARKAGEGLEGGKNQFTISLDGIALDDTGLSEVRNAAVKGALDQAKALGRPGPGLGNFGSDFDSVFSTFSTFSTFSSGC